jgi:ribosome-binding protein aMBF1 (putative translation factor)
VLITPAQAKAARDLLGWSRATLARKSSLVSTTVTSFERGEMPTDHSILKMARAMEAAGVAFDNGREPGVKLRKPK